MAATETSTFQSRRKPLIYGTLAVGAALATAVWPVHIAGAIVFSLTGLVAVAPLVIPGIILAAAIIASGADRHVAKAFSGHPLPSILLASVIGAITPVCGVTVLPLMTGLLAAGVPLAPIMAFWLSSPVTEPAMLATTAAMLGFSFALGKTLAAFGLGVAGGLVTLAFAKRSWSANALRENAIVGRLTKSGSGCSSCPAPKSLELTFWRLKDRRADFKHQFLATGRLICICLLPAFMAEYALNAVLTPSSLAAYVGEDTWWAIPAAVLVGGPAYLDGYAALPLTRALIDNGMSNGAAMAFLVSGGVVSVWGAMAIFPVLKSKPFLLYLTLALAGSMLAGHAFEWAV